MKHKRKPNKGTWGTGLRRDYGSKKKARKAAFDFRQAVKAIRSNKNWLDAVEKEI